MADIVNLRSVRKRRARAGEERRADENRIRHGLTRAQKLEQAARLGRDAALLDAHRRETRSEEDDGR